MHHRRFSPLPLTLVLLLSPVALGHVAVTPAFGDDCGDCGRPCRCGDTVVCDTKLDGKDPVLSTVCSGDGLTVNYGVTLEVAGTLRGLTHGCGIRIPGGGSDVTTTITTGTIDGFEDGICSPGDVHRSQFTRLTIRRPARRCISLEKLDHGSNLNVIRQVNCQDAGGDGIFVEGIQNGIAFVRSENNGGSGFHLFSESPHIGGTLLRSQGLGNGGPGLENNGCGFTISLNRFSDNAGFGILDERQTPCTFPNTYSRNVCDRNHLGDSKPQGLCR